MHTARIIGIDYGTKRIGVAIADPLRLFAQPYGTFAAEEVWEALKALHAAEGVATAVVGWPLLPGGEEGRATERVQQFINRLRKQLRGVEVVRWDERYTSELAKERIYDGGGTRRRRRDKARVDAAAAGIILQEYLDHRGG